MNRKRRPGGRQRKKSRPSTGGMVAGFVAGALAATAGGLAAGIQLERRVVRRRFRSLGVAEDTGLGSLRGIEQVVRTPDGVALHVEIDEVADHAPIEVASDEVAGMTAPSELSLVFVHGYALSLDCWHYQRRHFRGRIRTILYDHRSHGRSTRSTTEKSRIPQLARDLAQVLDEVVPPGPVILVGHSMGGMTIMNLARTRPELFGDRIRGVALVHTSAGDLAGVSPVRGMGGEILSKVVPPALASLNRIPSLVSRARNASSDIGYVATRQFGFASEVSVEKVEFVSRMMAVTPLEVVADFYPAAFAEVDEEDGLAVLQQVETAVIGAQQDLFTPVTHTERIIELLPGADARILTECGHLGMIEHPQQENEVLDQLVTRVVRHL